MVWSCLVSILPGMAQTEKLIDYVNPFVGTDGYGNVYPGAQIPFGGIQMSPDTDSKYYDAASGYKYNHSTLLGFSLTHLSGTGIPDLGDFLFIPGTGEMKLDQGHVRSRKRDTVHVILMRRNGHHLIIMRWSCQIME